MWLKRCRYVRVALYEDASYQRGGVMRIIQLLLLVILAAGCVPGATGGGFKYPAGWPIASLKVPAGAKQVSLPGPSGENGKLTCDGELKNQGSAAEMTVWEVAFQYSGGESQLVSHIEAALKQEGFQRAGNYCRPGQRYWYLTPDGQRQVRLERTTAGGTDGYTLGICDWSQPRPDIGSLGLEPI
ncbi:hypothetical protein JW859_03920 [bacterium]|nr:hypothetical protein [bacterium]